MTLPAMCQAFSTVHVFLESPALAGKCWLPSLLPELAVVTVGLLARLFSGVLVMAG